MPSERNLFRTSSFKFVLHLAVLFIFAQNGFAQVPSAPVEIVPQLGPGGTVYGVAISPDGRFIASGSNTVKLWDSKSGREVRSFAGHSSNISSVAFSPNGRQIISG